MTAPARTAAAFYVLGVHGKPWVLNNEGPQDVRECAGNIGWQVRGGSPREDWAVCYWDAAAQTFRELDGERTFDIDRGPYTVEAHARFLSTLAAA